MGDQDEWRGDGIDDGRDKGDKANDGSGMGTSSGRAPNGPSSPRMVLLVLS